MDDLVAFIEARLTEDELWAKAASTPRWPDDNPLPPGGVHWTWGVGNNWDPVDPDPLEPYIGGYDGQWSQAVVLRSVEEWTGSVGSLPLKVAEGEEVRTADGAHIVRHDPARVLREVAMRRRTLAAYAWAREHPNRDQEAGYWLRRGATGTLLEELYGLANIWRDHPDFSTDWLIGDVDHG